MISVVVCSVNRNLALQVSRNIDETIGVPFEMIVIDNTSNPRSITQVYNDGARKAKFNIISFVHEDVLFKTENWGRIVVSYFENDKSLSLLGVAGGRYKSRTYSGWASGFKQFDCINVLHIDKNGRQERFYSNPTGSDIVDTVTLDGVFICATREAWLSTPFDENIEGFHLYDIDFSFRNHLQRRVAVTFAIDLVHITEGGNFGDEWISNTIKWHNAFRDHLPAAVDKDVPPSLEMAITKKWLHRLRGEKISFKNRIKWLKEVGAMKRVFLWPHVLVFLSYRFLLK